MNIPDDVRLKLRIYSGASGLVHANWCGLAGHTIETMPDDDPHYTVEAGQPCDCGVPDLIRDLHAAIEGADNPSRRCSNSRSGTGRSRTGSSRR